MRGRLYFGDERVFYLGPGLAAGPHAHHALQICIPLTGRIRLRSPGASWRTYDGAVIPSDVPHESDTAVPLLATLWLDAEAPAAAGLSRTEAASAIRPIGATRLRASVPLLQRAWNDADDGVHARALLEEAIMFLTPGVRPPDAPPDPRMMRAQGLLRAAPMRRMSLAVLARAVSLSPSRLGHLLRAHLGVPMRRYLLWLRLRDALGQLARGAGVTEAAHAAGFADAPHLDRTFRRMLGFTPSAALQVSQFVQDGSRRSV